MKKLNKLTFAATNRDFSTVLNKRVKDYFKQNEISAHANGEMFLKTLVMFALYFVPYGLIISGAISGTLMTVLLVIIMSLGLAGIGLSVMHDGNHGAYSNKKWLNDIFGYTLNMIGANSFNWKMQHNVLHHTYTNVHDYDEDISPRGVLRLTPHSSWKAIHKYQFIYAWFLYGLMTIIWMVFKDFERMIKYQRNGMIEKHKGNANKEWAILIVTKVIYIGYIFILPIMLTPWLWWQVLIGILLMHYITGFILAIIFQLAHVVEETEYPVPDDENKLENNWAIHQLHTTNNFSNNSRWFSWYIGGLNFQIEHHLFPYICHVHYRKISGIVKTTAGEFGLPYKSKVTFFGALLTHLKHLRKLGIKPA